jgi:hypothetical protein
MGGWGKLPRKICYEIDDEASQGLIKSHLESLEMQGQELEEGDEL